MTKTKLLTSVFIKYIAYALTLFFVFILFSAIIASFFKPQFTSVAIDKLPDHFPLVVTWKSHTGTPLCRIILQQQKKELLTQLPSASLNVTQQDMSACDYALDYLRNKNKWPYALDSDQNLNNIASIDLKKSAGTDHFEVNYSEEFNSHNAARYSVANNQLVTANYKYYENNQYSFKAAPYSFIATLIFWWFYTLYKKYLKIRFQIK